MSRILFHRPARFTPPDVPAEKVVLPLPPDIPPPNTAGTWLMVLLPLLGSIGMSTYMITFGRPLLVVIGILFVLGSLGATLGMRWQLRRSAQRTLRRKRQRYRQHLAATRRRARQVAAHQRLLAAWSHPAPARLLAIAARRDRVWERRQTDPDFLKVRLGLGEAELATPLQINNRLDPMTEYDWESLRAARRLVARFGRVQRQPVPINLGECGVMSVLGPAGTGAELVAALLCQVAVLHAPSDVLIAIDANASTAFDWGKWLPHTHEPDAVGRSGVLPLVATKAEHLTDFLAKELLRRQELAASRRSQIGYDRRSVPVQQRLIVVFNEFDPVTTFGQSQHLRDLLEHAGPQLGITLIFLTGKESDEPGRVDLRLRVGADAKARAEGRLDHLGTPAAEVIADLVRPGVAEQVARRLAPLILGDEREEALARTSSLTDMLFGDDLLTADLTTAWVNPDSDRVLRVPIGNDGDGDAVILDLKESAQGGQGPHGLIVGATGSGKSELMRTLVTALALTHSPDLLSFVLVDFKGGATFAPLVELPHVAGLITNLADDMALVDRMRQALQGEQQRRQQLLRAAGNVDSVRDYQVRQAAGTPGPDGKPLEPLPYLLIIVDEFGELLSRRSDLVELFVQIGRVGRSLGMHLLLATQRLEEGRLRGLDSHLSYRVCLRTFSAGESRTVIGTTDAYRLPSIPGSAYLKVDESVYQRFRVAHVSAPYAGSGVASQPAPPAVVEQFDLRHSAVEELAVAALPVASGPAESQVVVSRLRTIGRLAHQVWLPPLPVAISLDDVLGPIDIDTDRGLNARLWPMRGQLKMPVGIVDLPAVQQQQTMVMDFGGPHGHLAVVGAPQTGRSTMLRTMLLAGMLTHTPDEFQVCCVDFGGGGLHPFAAAPHVTAVAGRTDPELVTRTVAEAQALMVDRERLFRELGIDSIADFRTRRAAGTLPAGTRAADLFVVIDNWGAMKAEFDHVEAAVTDIAARGLGVGVHLILTANRWIEIRPALRDSIGTRLELRLNDPTESEVSRALARQMTGAPPGRALVAPGAFCQLLLPRVDGVGSAEGVGESMHASIDQIARHCATAPAPSVRLLPPRITVGELGAPVTAGVAIGVREADLATVGVDLRTGDPHLLVVGDTGSGKSSTLRTWIAGCVASQPADEARIVLVDYRRSLIASVPPDHLGAYAGNADAAREYTRQIAEKLRERLPPPDISVDQLQRRDWWRGPEIYLVIDDYDLVGSAPLAPLVEFLPHAREVGLHIVAARRVSGFARTLADPLFNRVRELGCAGLLLSGDRREGMIFGEERPAPRPPGRGVLVHRGQPATLIQVATVVAEDDLRLVRSGRAMTR